MRHLGFERLFPLPKSGEDGVKILFKLVNRNKVRKARYVIDLAESLQ